MNNDESMESCLSIVYGLSEIASKRSDFDQAFLAKDFTEAKRIKAEIKLNLEALGREILNPGELFLIELRKEQFWQRLSFLTQDLRVGGFSFIADFVQSRMGINQLKRQLTSFDYQRFARDLDGDNQIRRFVDEFRQKSWIHNNYSYSLDQVLSFLNDAFLIHFLSRGTSIETGEVPEILRHQFARALESGRVSVPELGHNAGQDLNGGTLVVDKAATYVGRGMLSGTLVVQHSEGYALSQMAGGTAYLGAAEGDCCNNREGGQVLIGDWENTIVVNDNDLLSSCFYYDDDSQIYCNMWAGLNSEIELSPAAIEDRRIDIRDPDAVMVLKDFNQYFAAFGKHPTEDMVRGFMVYRDLPQSDIGKGMENGILILEVPGLTLEDAQRRLAPSKDRPGGVVMIRIWDESGKSKLEVVGS